MPVVVGGATIRPGDLVVLDCDGAVVLPAGASTRCCRSRSSGPSTSAPCETGMQPGELSYDLQGLRDLVED